MTRAVLTAALGAALLCSPAVAAHASTASCSTKSLKTGGAKVIEVRAAGLSCTKALGIARTVASQVAKTGNVDVQGVSSFAVSSSTCTGCGGTKTQVVLSYPSGAKLTISIRGGKSGSIQSPTPIPQPLPAPALPSPGSSGSGPITV